MKHRNDGLRKRCDCARRVWAKCPHPWHFNFKCEGEVYRFSLDRVVRRLHKDAAGKWRRDLGTLGEPITSKTAAERAADDLRSKISKGELQHVPAVQPLRDTLTLGQLLETYRKHHIAIKRPGTVKNTGYQIGMVVRTPLERADGTVLPFGEWLVTDIGSGTIDQFQRVRLTRGVTAANRDLALLRAMFRWAIGMDHVERTPFKKGGETVIKLTPEHKRRRRLHAGEGERLLAVCRPHLRALVEAAIETGCRRGELLSLQWHQVRFEPKGEIFLPAQKTKTKQDRTVPITSRLKVLMEMRRTDPDGEDLPPHAYVFGNEIGEPCKGFKRAWERAVLVSHGQQPVYTKKPRGKAGKLVRTAVLAPESRVALRAIDLHFHDLRREAGSRWLEGGVPLHRIRQWLGHANISQTSTYLMAESADDDDEMRRFETRVQRRATISETGEQTASQSGTTGETDTPKDSMKHH